MCGLQGGVRLQYMNKDFDVFVNLTSTTDLCDLSTIRVIQVNTEESVSPSLSSKASHSNPTSEDSFSIPSADTDDTVILSSSSESVSS